MNTNINTTEYLGNTTIVQEASEDYDKIVDGLIQYLKDQNITTIEKQKIILNRTCTKLSEQPVELLELELSENKSALSKQNKKLIQANTVKIIDAFKKDEMYFIRLLESCVAYGIFNKNDKETIQSNASNQEKYSAFLSILPRRGNIAEAVIKELQKQNIISTT